MLLVITFSTRDTVEVCYPIYTYILLKKQPKVSKSLYIFNWILNYAYNSWILENLISQEIKMCVEFLSIKIIYKPLTVECKN